MRAFVITALALFCLLLGGWYAVFCLGFYIDLHPGAPVSAPFRAQGQTIQRQNERGEWEDFVIRGVDLSSSMPGHYASDFAPTQDDYLRWLEGIGGLGANTVRVLTVMDDDFYNALYDYNTTHDTPLYLLQGIQVSDQANYGAGDAYGADFLDQLRSDSRLAVDAVHGRRVIPLRGSGGGDIYRRDVSPWVLGYLVGHEWDSGIIAYTNHSAVHTGDYQGTYFTTAPEAAPFEALLAQVMDELVGYESGKYKTQRLVAFINDPANDPFEYDSFYAAQLSKYNQLDAQNIRPTGALESGYFAAYRLYDFCPAFQDCFSQAQRAALGAMLDGLDSAASYDGYLELLGRYHTMPVVAAGYGFSTSRGAVTLGQPPLTEAEQGQALVRVYQDAMDAGWSGVFLSTWQDVWDRRTWNTAFAVDINRAPYWHDLQTDGQGYGLLAFEPGAEGPVCVLDGAGGEWAGEDVVLDAGGITLSARYDAQGLYLLLQGEAVGPDTPLYLPIDITDELGSGECRTPALTFEREADFLLVLDGTDRSRLLVQARYSAVRANFQARLDGEDPFADYPAGDSPRFVPVEMAVQDLEPVSREADSYQNYLSTWETGRLTHGCGDPDDPAYNSLADFCFGESCVEIRLPWLLLNVADPSAMQVHRDYYQHYGVSTKAAGGIWLGVGDGAETIPMERLALSGWDAPETRERLKASYAIVQAAWREGDHAPAGD